MFKKEDVMLPAAGSCNGFANHQSLINTMLLERVLLLLS